MPLLLLLPLDAELLLDDDDDDDVSAIAEPEAASARATQHSENEMKNATRFIPLTSRTST
jgi:prephenate dehydratase